MFILCMYVHTCYVLIKPPMPIHYVLAAVFASCFYVLKSLLHEWGHIFYYVRFAVFASCFYVLFKFRFVREAAQGGTLVNPLKIMCFFIYDANYFINVLQKKNCFIAPLKFCFIFDVNYFINFFKKICFENGLKTGRLYILYRYCKAHRLNIWAHY